MKKIILLFIGVLLFISASVFAQTTMSIATVTAAAGATVSLPVNVSNFNNVGAISLKISYSSSLTFVGIANPPANVTFTPNASNGTLMIGWFDATASSPINISNGKLFDLKFTSNGNAGTVDFVTTGINPCDISNESGTSLVVNYSNGGVTGSPAPSFKISTITAASGSISVPLVSQHLVSVGAISLKINYDPAILTFTGIANSPTGFTANASNGIIAISWFDATGNTPLNIDNVDTLLNLRFTYNGGTSALTFDTTDTSISNSAGVTFPIVNYTNGQVSSASGGTSLTLGNITNAAGAVSVPLTATSTSNFGAISLKVDYNPAVLSFTNVTTSLSGVTFTASASNGVVSISWFDQTGTTPITVGTNKALLNLNFNYLGGSSTLNFETANSEISSGAGVKINGIAYNNGSVSGPVATTTTLTLGNVQGAIGTTATVPLTVQKFSNVGAISLKINYNSTALTFSSISNAPAGVTFTASAASGVLSISWFDQTGSSPINLDSNKTLLKINFTYNGGSSPLTFNAATSEISTELGVAIPNVVYVNGNVTSNGPRLTIGNVIATAGSTVTVPVTMQKFSSVGAISLKIDYDPNILSNVTITNVYSGLTFTSGATNGVLSASWFDATGGTSPINTDSAKLFNISFTYLGGSSNISFDQPNCEIANSSGVVINNVTFINGSIKSGVSPTVSLPNLLAPKVNASISVPMMVKKFNNVGAISMKVQYNAAVLTFTGVTNTFGGKSFTSSASNGVITLGFFDQSGNSPISITPADSAVLLNLNFTYLGGSSSLTFGVSEIADNFGDVISGVTYINGSITPFADHAPVFTSVIANNALIVRDLAYSFQYKASDVDGDTLTFSLKNPPAGSSIAAKTGIFSWKPGISGKYAITVSVTDGILSVDTTVSVNVVRGPYFTKVLPDTQIVTGKLFQFTYVAVDSSGLGILRYTLDKGPAGSSIRTANGAFSWLPDSTEVKKIERVTVTVSNGTLSATTTTILDNIISGLDFTGQLPKEYNLSQNYPNPFNPSTTINFDLPKESKVVLKVFNILGQEVATLVNQNLKANSYNFRFNAVNLPSGIYIYRLQAGDFTLTKKMTLLK
jgi:hypothetical protein